MTHKLIFLFAFTFIYNLVESQNNKSPNIIYIYADDLGYGELGCYGQTRIKTPHIDQMAKEGIMFTQHYSSAPVCAPSRCMMMTGMHAGHAFIRGNYEFGGFEDENEKGQMPLDSNLLTIAKMLKKHHYTTAMIGKWGLGVVGTSGSPNYHGFDYYFGYLDQKQAHNYYPTHLWENDIRYPLNNPKINVHQALDSMNVETDNFNKYIGNEYAPNLMTNKAVEFIEKNKNNKFFLYLPYTLPHVSLQVPEAYVNMYKGQFDEKPYYGKKGYAACRYPLSTYAGMVTYLDDQVGIIMNKIKALGLDNETIIMFSSDNGSTFLKFIGKDFFNLTGGLRGAKMDLYEGGIKVPFIARWPGKIKPNTTTNHLSTQYDLFSTLVDLVGDKNSVKNDGISFKPTLLDVDQKKQHAYLYFEYPENGGQVAIRMGDWKGVKKNLIKSPNAEWELFNINKDPLEKQNLSKEYPNIGKRFDKIISKEHKHPIIKEWEIVDTHFK